ncbi:MAG: ATP-binding region ATPase domain protein [Gemmatimonadetes bacterium]|nr:ATP-binding region ATPase domain protein [Gemmatimonadota bacterium]
MANDDMRASTVEWMGDALDVGALTVDRELRITSWNRWLEAASGLSAAEVRGRSLMDVGLPIRDSSRAALERAVNGATVVLAHRLHGYFIELPAPAGYPRYARMQQSVRILPVPDGGGAVLLIQDVTERVAREEELRVAMEEAQQANQAKAEFLASMSHELRTPIGAMSGYADLLAEGIFGPVSESQRSQLIRIKVVGAHLLSIVEEILSFARIEAGRETVHVEPVDVATLISDAVSAIEPLASRKGLSLLYTLPANATILNTDGVKVRQILINLLGNAVKFTDTGSVSLDLGRDGDGMTTFEITDTGPGIAEADHSRIFEPFVQVDGKLTRAHNGTGLGLSVSRVLARLLGGELTVTSVVGAGATFKLVLPETAQPL